MFSPQKILSFFPVIAMSIIAFAGLALASSTSNFQQTISSGSLSIDIVDNASSTVASPSVTFGAATFSYECNTSTGTFGTASERIYISNPDAADNGWTASLAAQNATSVWDSAGTDMDFNEPGAGGCVDDGGSDADALGGQMHVDPSAGSVSEGPSQQGVDGISLGSASEFVEGVTDSITIATSDGTTDVGDWGILGVSISQTIPASQPAAADYDINMVLSIVAT